MNLFTLTLFLATALTVLSRTPFGRRLGFRRGTAPGLGLALQQLATFTQPRAEHAIQFQLQDETDEDDSGDPNTPEGQRRHLLRQALRLRRGTLIGPLTVLASRSHAPGH